MRAGAHHETVQPGSVQDHRVAIGVGGPVSLQPNSGQPKQIRTDRGDCCSSIHCVPGVLAPQFFSSMSTDCMLCVITIRMRTEDEAYEGAKWAA